MTLKLSKNKSKVLQQSVIAPEVSLAEAMVKLKPSGIGMLFVCDENRKLLGVLTDGDIRRAVLDGIELSIPCLKIINESPITVPQGTSLKKARAIIEENTLIKIHCLPVLDSLGKIVDVILRTEVEDESVCSISALIMAGGLGSRLGKLTKDTPKPLLNISGKPLVELTLEHLRRSGVERVFIATHFLKDRIKSRLGDGSEFGLNINYIEEKKPLGTAGAIGLLPPINDTILLMNGDILTEVDIKAMLDFHRFYRSDMTVAVKQHSIECPYGVMDCSGNRIMGIVEKPTSRVFVNAGIYMIQPSIRHFVVPEQSLDMNQLISKVLAAGRDLIAFPIIEYWLDIGRQKDYQAAQLYERKLNAA